MEAPSLTHAATLWKDTLKAIAHGDANQLRSLITQGTPLDEPQLTPERNTMTPLMQAAYLGQLECVNLLLDAGSDPQAYNPQHMSALMYGAMNGHTAVVDRLLKTKSEPHRTDYQGLGPLAFAAYGGHTDCVNLLIHAGVQINTPGHTHPLLFAALHADCTKALLKAGAHQRCKTQDHLTPVMVACKHDNAQSAQLLIDAGADIHEHDKQFFTPLMIAAAANSLSCSRLLLHQGASINACTPDGSHALEIAIKHKHHAIAQLLIESGADLQMWSNQLSLLHTALLNDNLEGMRMLLETHAFDTQTEEIQTVFNYAILTRKVDFVEFFIERGIDINFKNITGTTPLMMAASLGHTAMIAQFIAHKAELHLVDNDGLNAMDHAKITHHLEAYALLEQHCLHISTASTHTTASSSRL